MHLKRKRRLMLLIFMLFGVSIAVAFMLYALQQNINLYYTPSQIAAGKAPVGHLFRIGGMVKKGSVKRSTKKLQVSFVLTDYSKNVKVEYAGILPDLFREGQGIVAQGKLNKKGIFIADQVLAKHSADYMPPVIKDALAS